MFAAIIAALAMTADGIAEGLYAARHRFSARAASLGYAVAAGLGWLYNVATPVNFTVESITVATRTAKKRPEILYIVVLSAVPSIILGLTGLYSAFVDFLEPAVISGVIAGVGIILAGVAFGYLKERPAVAGMSTLAGVIAWMITEDLVVVIIASMAAGSIARYVVPKRFQKWKGGAEAENGDDGENGDDQENGGGKKSDQDSDEVPAFEFVRPHWKDLFTRSVLVGAFSLFALRIGSVVSYDEVNSDLADQDPTLDGTMVMTGAASLVSSLFGGPPLEATPAPMASTPMPGLSTVLFMALMIVVAATGLIGKVGKFLPLQAISGFLLVLGIPVIIPDNITVVADSPLAGGVALVVTALSNPFYGLLAGQAVALFA